MIYKKFFVVGGLAALAITLAAIPGPSAAPKQTQSDAIVKLQQQIDALQSRLEAERVSQEVFDMEEPVLAEQEVELQQLATPGNATLDSVEVIEIGSSWLGVETHEVTAEKAKALKLSAERGVVIGKVIPDSPAAKAGLKENDVVTEINGQRVEGAEQFRRMIREIPAGRTVQLTVWRDGRSQSINATLGSSEERHHKWMGAPPGAFAFHMPDMPAIAHLPGMEWNGELLSGGRPRLGIDAEDLNGQLGSYFGAPDGEGVLVRAVNSGSPAEKAGMKAGDVITSLDGARIRTVGDLREKLAARTDDKPAKVGVLRNKTEATLNVELPAPAAKTKHLSMHKTTI